MVIRKVLVNGNPLEVALEADGTYRLGDREGQISVVEVEPGVYSVLRDGRSYEVRAVDGRVWIAGERFEVEIDDPRAPRKQQGGAAAGGQRTLKAAMPGKVVRLLVHAGDEVTAGQGIAVMEAMKMQNEVKSPVDGKVLSVAVQEGAAVAGGDTIAVIG